MADPTWESTVEFLRSVDHPWPHANAGLLATAAHWEGKIVPRTSMFDLLFTLPGDGFPFPDKVGVSWMSGVFEFRLYTKQVSLVAGDFARDDAAPAVLESFLEQLSAARPTDA